MKAAHWIIAALVTGAAGIASAEGPVAYPGEGPADAALVAVEKTRVQVKAELDEARRLGLVVHGEVNDKIATPEQLERIADAGRRAAKPEVASR